MELFIIGYGLAGGFGGVRDFVVEQAKNEDDAYDIAFEYACEHYENYLGMYGLRDLGQIMEEDEIEDEDDAVEIFEQEREDWLAYIVYPYSKEQEKICRNKGSFHNSYAELTDKL